MKHQISLGKGHHTGKPKINVENPNIIMTTTQTKKVTEY